MQSHVEAKKTEDTVPREEQPRFRIIRLEERIAPACHYNPHGKLVGCHYRYRYR